MNDLLFERNPYRRSSGIYIIRSMIDDRCYVGGAKSIAGRHKSHRNDLKRNRHGNRPSQNFVNKYGIECLKFEILEYCEVEKLVEREQYYLDMIKPSFNILKVARSPIGSKKGPMPEWHRKKCSEGQRRRWQNMTSEEKAEQYKDHKSCYTPEVRAKISAAAKKRRWSQEHKNKISASLKGRSSPTKGRRLTEEHKEKCRIASTGKKHTEEAKMKISKALKGRVRSPEWCANLSKALKGKRNSQEAIDRMAAKMRGKKHSEETKAKMRIVQKRRRKMEKMMKKEAK